MAVLIPADLPSNVVTRDVGGWIFLFSPRELKFPREASAQVIHHLQMWIDAFPREETWVRHTYGVPSLIVRVEGVWRANQFSTYEIEERPAGVGLSSTLNSRFRKNLHALRQRWPGKVEWVQSLRRTTGDDDMWLGKPLTENIERHVGPLLIRADPDETEFHALEQRSISSLRQKGNKSYGVTMGWWREATAQDYHTLPWSQGFVLKPLQGSKCRDVHIWVPGSNQLEGIAGMASETKIRTALTEHGRMYVQPLLWPMSCPENKRWLMMYRMFFGYDPQQNAYTPLGGMWNARKSFLLHGTSETLFGPLVPE